MTEIGGYFELETLIHNEYYGNLVPLNTARNCLVYLCKAKKISKIFLPYFLCNSVSNVCIRENIDFEFYHIDKDFLPVFDKKIGEKEYLYIVNYYGQLSNEKVLELKEKYKNIILDNVQAFFSKPIKGIDTIYSCRKFFGVPDGAYLSTDEKTLELDQDVSFERMKHLLGRYEGKSASDYYDDFKKNDKSFEKLPLMSMSKLTHNLLGAIDYESTKEKREENWKYVDSILGDKNKLILKCPNGPYMYPFYCDNGLEVKKKLAEKGIYIPTLWPNVLELNDCELEKEYAANILPLSIDQRYDNVFLRITVNNMILEGII